MKAVIGLSVECTMKFVAQVFEARTASKCMVCKPRSGTVNVNRAFLLDSILYVQFIARSMDCVEFI